ncbi:glycosyltransferase family 2 protein [Phaeobacter gallaeciensis]|uniref:Glycosyltransferase family 2 protein n=2 Tax=Roseobacteraceae TaxID=2854170 RepID=A0A366WK07_9RHOB|nr:MULTISPECIES: glycosyltransferase family 2 protein [Roseobacteraceae]MBT3139810.1 glycosyltransferase family 2 protein [Falsiruegeria litorea]MBT8167049.1 glycosyltransferase family 2 protein [Falsiruegeria litorea]RBW49623.1 glycosyltransferase family 2 protein [Phaeobacter gallaeciensis]
MGHALETWGLVATIKAPTAEVLRFVAYHLELGAHRLHIYLDAPDAATYAPLKANPKVRVTQCDARYWKNRKRPEKHQVRQTVNATRTYRRQAETAWLAHIDVDEFLWPQTTVADALSALPPHINCARLRPREALPGDNELFKDCVPSGPERDKITQQIYPTFGAYVKGGFMSHVAGKLFVRTGLPDIEFRIHNAFQNGQTNPGHQTLDTMALCHAHAQTWDAWIAAYRFRLAQGSYRSELAPNKSRTEGGLTMHELLSVIEDESGQSGLKRFYDELNAVDPVVRQNLQNRGMLHACPLHLDRAMRKHFPDFS